MHPKTVFQSLRPLERPRHSILKELWDSRGFRVEGFVKKKKNKPKPQTLTPKP